MPERPTRVFVVSGAIIVVALGTIFGLKMMQGRELTEINFSLGRNIVDTVKASGALSFSTREVAGLITYKIAPIPNGVHARYDRPGFEIKWEPLYALTMYADRDWNASLPVESVTLQLDSHIDSHAAAQAFVEHTIAQFQKGRWQRFCDPAWETLLTGRSSLLDETGQIAQVLRTIDPAFKIPAVDWLLVSKSGAHWLWSGDGVIAKLSVTQLGGSGQPGDARPLDYRFDMSFDLADVLRRRQEQSLAHDLKEGDAKGWNSTSEHHAEKKARLEQLKRLEANAVKRGDSVLTPH